MPIVTESNVQTKEFFQFKVLSNVRLCPRFCPRSNAPESARCLFTAFCKDNKLKAAHFDIFMMMPVVLLYNIQSFDYRGFLKLEVIDFAFIVMSLTRDEDRRGRRHQPVSEVSKVDLICGKVLRGHRGGRACSYHSPVHKGLHFFWTRSRNSSSRRCFSLTDAALCARTSCTHLVFECEGFETN